MYEVSSPIFLKKSIHDYVPLKNSSYTTTIIYHNHINNLSNTINNTSTLTIMNSNRRHSMGRRYAKSPLELIAEIPHHLRRRSTQGALSHAPSSKKNTHTTKIYNRQQSYHIRSDLSKPRLIRSTNNCASSIGGSHVSNQLCAQDVHKSSTHRASTSNPRTTLQKCNLVRSTHSPIHRRQHAMVWDDLISVLCIEVMEDTPTTLQSCTDDYSLYVHKMCTKVQHIVHQHQTPAQPYKNAIWLDQLTVLFIGVSMQWYGMISYQYYVLK